MFRPLAIPALNAFEKSGKNAMPNCAQNQTAHKTINTRKLGE
jgi:hypothetical protein